ncbi:hypothetical protein NBH15_00835 [Parabacteroides sp. W1-Q-101]|uniref:hypothetical protein n=1 Tax=Parabacteroides caeci TaxID=2949650 RepID=UPI00202F9BD5|nr:hypothetical protein [Parabacteroides sp. W1-Q-101]MCM0716817.1 hypothetical protein [Parabacteroides sp. W1-Q-101]
MKTQRIRFMFIVVTLFALTTSIKSQSIYHMVHFDVSSPSNVLDFDYTFKEFTSIQYNLPFADYFAISGNRLVFKLSADKFLWYFARRVEVTNRYNDQYVDLTFSQIDSGTICGDKWTSYQIVRDDDNKITDIKEVEKQISGSGSLGNKEGIVRIYYYK